MDAPFAPTSGAAERVVAACDAAGVELVRFLYVDNGGLVRGKAAATRVLRQRMAGGIGLTVAMLAMNILDELQPVPGMGPVGEVRLVPDPATFAVLPYASGAAAMCCDLLDLEGRPWAACPRSFLRAVLADLRRDGFIVQAAYEPEFTVGRRVPGPDGVDTLVPLDESVCFGGGGFTEAHDYVVELVRALGEQGLQVELYYPELGHGQQELSIRHADGLAAADRMVLYRETVRAVARRRGLWASLAPKPLPDQAGNGAHLHLSLWDVAAGSAPSRNVFFEERDRFFLSHSGYAFIGGVLAHLPALLALTCGSVNSYRRLQPRMWTGAYTCFGPDNREAAVRIASPLRESPIGPVQPGAEPTGSVPVGPVQAGSVNLELKPVDATANPYLALGAVLLAGADGIRRGLDPGSPLMVDPANLTDAERDERGIARLPESLGGALDALERDEVLAAALGEPRLRAYLAVRRSELAAFAGRDVSFECFAHFTRF